MEKCKYLYLCISPYDKGVYQTQVVDWLNLYRDNALEFELTQLWTTNPFSRTRKKYQISQNEMIKAAYKGPFQSWNLFPRTFGLSFFDRFIFRRKIAKYLDKYEKVVLFCRYDAAPVFGYVNKVFPGRVFYYSDLRGAGAEEYMDRIKSTKDYTEKAFKQVAAYYYKSYINQKVATKIFAVSNALIKYNEHLFEADASKFVLYPCLSTTSKFYYEENLRMTTRKELGLSDDNDVFVYTGSLDTSYNCVDAIVALFATVYAKNPKAKLLIIAKKITEKFQRLLENYPDAKDAVVTLESVPNQEMVKYLNAADFALLLRENVVLNNVSSPVKFAEFQLCGLPVIISESIYDYSRFCKENNTGFVLSNEALDTMNFEEVGSISKHNFDRKMIARLGVENLSKESHVKRIINELKVS